MVKPKNLLRAHPCGCLSASHSNTEGIEMTKANAFSAAAKAASLALAVVLFTPVALTALMQAAQIVA